MIETIICSIDGCGNGGKIVKGLCEKHYARIKRHGDPGVVLCRRNPSITCSVGGCEGKHKSKGFCSKHYLRFRAHGNPLTLMKRENGTGWVSSGGYKMFGIGGKRILEHRIIMAKHIGRELTDKEVVHHIDRDKLNNKIENLMLLPDRAAHKTQHQREDAFNACGDSSWMKCPYCKKYDDPKKMKSSAKKSQSWHQRCRREYRKIKRDQMLTTVTCDNCNASIEVDLYPRTLGVHDPRDTSMDCPPSDAWQEPENCPYCDEPLEQLDADQVEGEAREEAAERRADELRDEWDDTQDSNMEGWE